MAAVTSASPMQTALPEDSDGRVGSVEAVELEPLMTSYKIVPVREPDGKIKKVRRPIQLSAAQTTENPKERTLPADSPAVDRGASTLTPSPAAVGETGHDIVTKLATMGQVIKSAVKGHISSPDDALAFNSTPSTTLGANNTIVVLRPRTEKQGGLQTVPYTQEASQIKTTQTEPAENTEVATYSTTAPAPGALKSISDRFTSLTGHLDHVGQVVPSMNSVATGVAAAGATLGLMEPLPTSAPSPTPVSTPVPLTLTPIGAPPPPPPTNATAGPGTSPLTVVSSYVPADQRAAAGTVSVAVGSTAQGSSIPVTAAGTAAVATPLNKQQSQNWVRDEYEHDSHGRDEEDDDGHEEISDNDHDEMWKMGDGDEEVEVGEDGIEEIQAGVEEVGDVEDGDEEIEDEDHDEDGGAYVRDDNLYSEDYLSDSMDNDVDDHYHHDWM
ncbi:uncharacterized protein BCR38DRAFT_426583 [Pseudomassariella vexata]|uniref:Uncharacterized protein n=1 Tax=Pseudomassariella vexata TaxID=1141098 RepID=A0A1Y2E775_9PEZI|nr:uncharacterized protein BCR38DRAFT_426583 [Pseudomassariella vexata]ORY67287.1 hypothetical protein BCR38DRAFT_426583 [Pseudomassariella vexata]